MKILVIDDDPLVRLTLQKVLERQGYTVALADDGLKGLHAFQRERPALVITDIIMPVKEGLDAIRLMRSWSPATKIIAISGGSRHGNVDVLDQAVDLGASAILRKPFDPDDLVAEVGRCLADA